MCWRGNLSVSRWLTLAGDSRRLWRTLTAMAIAPTGCHRQTPTKSWITASTILSYPLIQPIIYIKSRLALYQTKLDVPFDITISVLNKCRCDSKLPPKFNWLFRSFYSFLLPTTMLNPSIKFINLPQIIHSEQINSIFKE